MSDIWNKRKRSEVMSLIRSPELRAAGWKVLRIWEHSLKLPGPLNARIRKALAADPPKHA